MEPEPSDHEAVEEGSSKYARKPLINSMGQVVIRKRTAVYAAVGLMLFVGLIIQSAGVASAVAKCDSYYLDGYRHYSYPTCRYVFDGFWWALVFQFFVCIGIGIVVVLNILEDMRAVLLCFLTLSTLQLMERTDEALALTRSHTIKSQMAVTVAGFIISAIANFILIFIVAVKKMPKLLMPILKIDVTYPHDLENV